MSTLSGLLGGAGKPTRITTYTSGTGSFTPLSTTTSWLRVTLVGGGAGGDAATGGSGSGGGGGGSAVHWLKAVNPSYSYIVGAGGTGGATPSPSPLGWVASAGGNTSFGSFMTLGGGNDISIPGPVPPAGGQQISRTIGGAAGAAFHFAYGAPYNAGLMGSGSAISMIHGGYGGGWSFPTVSNSGADPTGPGTGFGGNYAGYGGVQGRFAQPNGGTVNPSFAGLGGGGGGASIFSTGGAGGSVQSPGSAASGDGATAPGYGGGGGGGARNTTSAPSPAVVSSGGNGSGGVIIIEEFTF